MEWFSSLEPLLKAYWIIAFTVSFIFIIQTIMTFVGMDSGDGLNADFDGDLGGGDIDGGHEISGPFQLFTLRNLINFFLGFGWSGVCLYYTISSKILLNIVSFIIGCIFVFLFFLLIKQILKLAKDNTFKMTDLLELTADVYLHIPALKGGIGKIQVSVRGSVHEIDAMTEGEEIPTGGKVKVVQLIDNKTVLVVKI